MNLYASTDCSDEAVSTAISTYGSCTGLDFSVLFQCMNTGIPTGIPIPTFIYRHTYSSQHFISSTPTNTAQTDTKTWLEASNAYFNDNDAVSIHRSCSKKSPIDEEDDSSKYVLFKYFMGGDNEAYDSCTDSSTGVVDSPFFEAYPGTHNSIFDVFSFFFCFFFFFFFFCYFFLFLPYFSHSLYMYYAHSSIPSNIDCYLISGSMCPSNRHNNISTRLKGPCSQSNSTLQSNHPVKSYRYYILPVKTRSARFERAATHSIRSLEEIIPTRLKHKGYWRFNTL